MSYGTLEFDYDDKRWFFYSLRGYRFESESQALSYIYYKRGFTEVGRAGSGLYWKLNLNQGIWTLDTDTIGGESFMRANEGVDWRQRHKRFLLPRNQVPYLQD